MKIQSLLREKLCHLGKKSIAFIMALIFICNIAPSGALEAMVAAANSSLPAFQMTFNQVTNANQMNEDQPVYMLNGGKTATYRLQLSPGYTSGEASGITVQLASPYLYYDDNNLLQDTYDKPQTPSSSWMTLRTMVSDLPSANWALYGTDSTTVFREDGTINDNGGAGWDGQKLPEENFYFCGKITAKLLGTAQPSPIVFSLLSKYVGDVPENASASIDAGMQYTDYYNGSEHVTGLQTIPLGGNPDAANNNFNSIVFVNSNLTWEGTIDVANDPYPPLWDEYNYLTYKVTVKNTSEKPESMLDHFDLNLYLMNAVQNGGVSGVLEQDMMQWIYDNGKLVYNKDYTSTEVRENMFSGKPGEGGVLCYDVTDYTDEQLAEWDLTTLENIPEDPIPYYYTQPGRLNIPIDQPLYAPSDNTPGHISEKVYYVVVPYCANYYGDLNNTTTYTPTIFYGGKDYSWSQNYYSNMQFAELQPEFSQNKYVLDESGKPVKNGITGVGNEASYYINGIENTGNIPLFDAHLVDMLPDYFQLDSVVIHMNKKQGEDGQLQNPALEDWFTPGGDLLQVEFEDESGEVSWVSMGTQQAMQESEDGTSVFWKITLKNELQSYLNAHPDSSFTGRIRLAYKHRVNPNEALDGLIQVVGVPSRVIDYLNTVETTFQQWVYRPQIGESEAGYRKTDMTSSQSSATLKARPAAPQIDTNGVFYEASGEQVSDVQQVPMNEDKAGYRFHLWNNSISQMLPAEFETSGDFLKLISKDYYAGFTISSIVLNKELLERSTPTSITLIDIEGKEKTYAISGFKPNSDGDIVISRSVWEKTIPNLNGVRVNFSGFDSSVTKDDGCYIDIKGTPDLTGKRTITGIWQTDYSPDSGMTNVKDTDPGSITVEAINPYISATAGWYDKDDALQPNTSVPYLWEDSFYEFVFENRSESASTETNLDFTLSVKDVDNTAGTTLKGFVPDEIIISADWAEAADIEAVHFYNYGQTFDDTPALSINWADAVAQYQDPDTGEIRIPVKDFAEVTNLLYMRLECSHFNGNVYNKTNPSQPDLDNALHVTIHGTPEWHDALWASASFEPQSPLYEDATDSNSTYLDVEDFDPLVTGVSHWNNGNAVVDNPSQVPYRTDDAWYEFIVENRSISAALDVYFDLDLRSVANQSKTGGVSVRGFDADELVLSSNYAEAGVIGSIEFYDWNEMNGSTPNGTPTVLTAEELAQYVDSASGELRIPLSGDDSALPDMERVRYIRIRFDRFEGNVKRNAADGSDDSLRVEVYGNTDWHGTLTAYGYLKEMEKFHPLPQSDTGSASLTVAAFAPNVTATSHWLDGSNEKIGESTKTPYLYVPNKAEGLWYEFILENPSISSSGEGYIDLDISSVGNKTTSSETIKGFKSDKLIISKEYADICQIEKIELYDWDGVTGGKLTGTPVTLTAEQLKGYLNASGDIELPVGEAAGTVTPDVEYLRYVRIYFADFSANVQQGNTPSNALSIKLYGKSDWYGNLDVKTSLAQNDVDYTSNASDSDTGRFNVQRAYLALHSHIQYGDVTESVRTDNGLTDGNNTILGVPYDRDFTMWVQVENGSDPAASGYNVFSVLDDVDLSVTLPIKNASGAAFGASGSNANEAHTGFHVTRMRIAKELLEQYVGGITAIEFYDVDHPDAPVRLIPNGATGADITEFTVEGSDKTVTVDPVNGIVLSEEQLKELGIEHLAQVLIFSGKEMKVTGDDRDKLVIEFDGYEDSVFGTNDVLTANSTNYFDGVREEGNSWRQSAVDKTYAAVSKMYFDTTIVASYNDNDTSKKYTYEAQSAEHIREYYSTSSTSWGDDAQLEVGYKGIGSFGVDFRQYLNVGGSLPDARTYSYYSQEHEDMPWIHTQSLNTAATVNVEVELPFENFDTYYLKVDPRNKDYINYIDVTRENGDTYRIEKSAWVNNAVETASTGEQYFRINLANNEEPSYGENADLSDPNHPYYRDAYSYTAEGPENPVKSIVVNMDINQDQYTDDTQQQVKNPDYGTWYNEKNDSTRYSFEVNGRFYKLGQAKATASTTLTVGNSTDGRSKTRVDQGASNSSEFGRIQSSWSFKNYYRYFYYSGHSERESTARDMLSTVYVSVVKDNAYTRKGVHSNVTTEYDDTNVKFGDEDQFVVSFTRGNYYDVYEPHYAYYQLDHDYSGLPTSGHTWYYQDLFDWRDGRISFSDQIELQDTLPTIEPNSDYKYYGFLTTGIHVNNEVYDHMESITLYLTQFTEQTDAEGNVTGYVKDDAQTDSITLTKDQLQQVADGGEISFFYETEEETADPSKPYEVQLKKWQFVQSYTIDTRNWGGDADYNKESGLNHDAENGGTNTDIDLIVTGKPYVYVNQPATSFGDSIEHAQNHITPLTSTVYGAEDFKNFQANTEYYYTKDNNRVQHGWEDTTETAHMRGYLIPFHAGHSVEALDADKNIYDYEADNNTPETASFGVKVWNNKDGATERDMASRIDSVMASNTMDATFNLQTITIPKEFIDGTWFNVDYIQLVTANGNRTISLNELKPLLTANGDNYLFDVETWLHNNPELTSTYTLSTNGVVYTKAHITSFNIKFKAVNGNREVPTSVLQAGEYLTADHANGFAYTYEGVFVDRTQEDFQSDDAYNSWNSTSTPTFGKNANGYAVNQTVTNKMDAVFTSIDPNHDVYSDLSGTIHNASYYISNLVGELDVELTRTRDSNKFAYDKDDKNANAPKTDVDASHLLPWDYVEYTATIRADANALIPLEQTSARFVVPVGQRIVGWEIVSNDTDIPDSEITAVDADGNPVPVDTDLSMDGDALTNLKDITITIGDDAKAQADPDSVQIDADKGVVIRFITQMTDEHGDAYQGKQMQASFYAASDMKHGYSQYRIGDAGTGTGNYRNSGDAGTLGSSSGYTDMSYYRQASGNPILAPNTYYALVYSGLIFYTNPNTISVDYSFDKASEDYLGEFDGNPATVTVSGISNKTGHADEITVSVDFLKLVNGRYLQGFELTERLNVDYPANMPENTITERPPVKIEYFVLPEDLTNPNAYNNNIRDAEAIEKGVWTDSSSVTEEMLTRVTAVRVTYYDVAPYDTDGNLQALDNIVMHGVGRYQDIRLDNKNREQDDRFDLLVSVNEQHTHRHTETAANHLDAEKQVIATEQDTDTAKVTRETPVIKLQTQIFGDEASASSDWNVAADQLDGYRPNQTFWYRTSFENVAAATDTGVQGVVLNPVFYDKFPSQYATQTALDAAVSGDTSGIHFVWKDKDGVEKPMDGVILKVEKLTSQTGKDYGGAMIYPKSSTTKYGNVSAGKKFDDLDPRTEGISQDAEYTVYKISLTNQDGTDLRVEIGDTISMYYEATAHQDGLPMVLTDRDRNLGTTGDQYPSYFPRVGEYWSAWNTQSYPMLTTSNAGSVRQVNNSGILMDLDNLLHDVGFTSKKNDLSDLYEMYDGSTVYIPGTSSTDSYIGGNNKVFIDADVSSANAYQATRYTPGVASYTTENVGKLPATVKNTGFSGTYASYERDYAVFVTGPRTASSNNWEQAVSEEDRTPIIWTESRTHLEKAWLNVSSQMIPDVDADQLAETNNKVVDATRRYQNGVNPNYDWYATYWGAYLQGLKWQLYDRYVTTMESTQTYSARLQVSNYGDWGLDGVELTYTLPLGTKPLLDEDGNLQVSGMVLTGTSLSGSTVNDTWDTFDSSLIEATIVQTPEDDKGYDAPITVQDPRWTSDVNAADSFYTEENTVPYVVKIIIKKPLNEWFGRGAESGYRMYVDLKCQVESTNENGMWYDRVVARPYVADGSENHYYYQVYDMDQWEGDTTVKDPDTQIYGMDYLFSSWYYNSGYNYTYTYTATSPNTPSINGYNIQNNELQITDPAQPNGVNTRTDGYASYAVADTNDRYAQTGTSAEMRKPFLRLWSTVSEADSTEKTGSAVEGYYLDTEGDTANINVTVENRYWWDYYGGNGQWNYIYDKYKHSYPMDGGSMGTYYLPVVTVILPYGIVPMADDETTFTTNNKENATKQLKWDLSGRVSANSTETELLSQDEMDKFETSVTYEEIEAVDENGDPTGETEGRYVVRFEAKADSEDDFTDLVNGARILSGDVDIFSFKVFTYDTPKTTVKGDDGTEEVDKALRDRYQDVRTYISSKMDGFDFISDNDIQDNPYTVGSPAQYRVRNGQDFFRYDNRLDARIVGGTYPGGHIPVDVMTNGSFFAAGAEYKETDVFNVEDYAPDKRDSLVLSSTQKDFDASGANVHPDTNDQTAEIADIGLSNTSRIYTKSPRLTATHTVGLTKEEAGMSYGTDPGNYYPDADHPVEYDDVLWYGSKVTNSPEGSTLEQTLQQSGSVHHSRFTFVYNLPKQVTFWDEDDTFDPDDFYVEFYDSRNPTAGPEGDGVQRVSMQELLADGWKAEVKYADTYGQQTDPSGQPEYPTIDKPNEHDSETVVIELCPPADDGFTGYDSYAQGKKPAGYLASGSWINLKIKVRVDNLGDESTIDTEDSDVWDILAGETYVTTHMGDGSFNEGDGIDRFGTQSQDDMYWSNSRTDEPGTPAGEGTEAVPDKNYDKDYLLSAEGEQQPDLTDIYTYAQSAKLTLLKPNGSVRGDTSVVRRLVTDPDSSEEVVVDDPHIRGATHVKYYLDQAINQGGAVNRFIADLALPYYGTDYMTTQIAPIGDDRHKVEPQIKSIRTGVWEVPDTLSAEEAEVLKQQLRVYAFVRVSDDPWSEEGYLYPDTPEDRAAYDDGSWKQIGDSNGYALDENALITEGIPEQVRQIRFVIKAGAYEDEVAPTYYPVPNGFRLSVDADPDTDGEQEMDEIDPERQNINPLPENVQQNAAYAEIVTSSASETANMTTLHVNFFALCFARYDDMKYYCITEDGGRLGVYIDPELPYMGFKMEMGYFSGSYIKGYKWELSNNSLIIDPDTSKMMKYRGTVENLNSAQLIDRGYEDPNGTYTEDTMTNPNVSVVLPYIQALEKDALEYVPYDSLLGDNPDYLSDNYKVTGENLDKKTPHWTWHVERVVTDQEGNVVYDDNGKPKTEIVENNDLRLAEDPICFDTVVNLQDQFERRVVNFSFKGRLQPGENLVVEFMVPIESQQGASVSQSLMEAYGYGYKSGSYVPYIPTSDDSYGTSGFERDSRDLNNNGILSEMALRRTLSGLSFRAINRIKQTKQVDTQIDKSYDVSKGPASLPEGGDYTFTASMINEGTTNEAYRNVMMYDVLPYLGDYQVYGGNTDGTQIPRNSKWNGWLNPESIQVHIYDPNESNQYPDGRLLTMTTDTAKPADYDIWVGPFKVEDGQYIPLEETDLPVYKTEGTVIGTGDNNFYSTLYGNDSEKQKYNMVRLIDLLEFGKDPANAEAYEKAVKGIRSIWMEMEDPNYQLGDYTRVEMKYTMHSPLNLPKYVGSFGEDLDVNGKIEAAKEYSSWNTFVHHASGNGMTGEQSKAGVFVDAPAGRGYIGSYVWNDFDYNEIADEAKYETGTNGRPQIVELTEDLDFDGEPDDPGINGVKVELLDEQGYLVNRDGEAIVEETDPVSGVTKYALIDRETGEKQLSELGTVLYTDCGPAATYITESDYFDHQGYYILSNLKAEDENGNPMKYNLRFTFPEEYSSYAVTTLEIGETENRLKIYRKGDTLPDLGAEGIQDAPGDSESVTTLVAQTIDPIEVTPVELDTTLDADGSSPHQKYDLKMTSYNVGIARPYTIGGWTWLDEHEDPADQSNVLSDGLMTDSTDGAALAEDKLGQIKVTAYHYDPETEALTPANDIDGNPAEYVTEITNAGDLSDPANGTFTFHLKPGMYVLKAENLDTTIPLKPTPFRLNDDPLEENDDNDLIKVGSSMQTRPFEVTYEIDPSTGKPFYDEQGGPTEGQGYRPVNNLNLGFVNGGRGFLGDLVWNDEDYNGEQGMLELGIPNVEVTMERYYWDGQAWQQQKSFETVKTTNNAGVYVFNAMTTYTADDGQTYLAGYKLRIDEDALSETTLGAHYAVSKLHTVADAEKDSDLLTQTELTPTGNSAYYLTSAPVIIAAEAGPDAIETNVMEYDGKRYDVADALSDLTHDAGLKEFEQAEVTGYIWDDTDYDGLRQTDLTGTEPVDPGMAGVDVVLEQYIRTDDGFQKVGEATVQTDNDGMYDFKQVSTYYEDADGVHVTYYRIRVDSLPSGYRVTRYQQGSDRTIDSDLVASSLYLTENTAPLEEDYFTVTSVSVTPDNDAYCITEGGVKYDIVRKSGDVSGYDGGLKQKETAALTGIVWDDADYNGIRGETETRLSGVTVNLTQYYLNADGQWVQTTLVIPAVTTDASGVYTFSDLPAHVEVNGVWYLAGYKASIPRQTALGGYEATHYHQGTIPAQDSDAVGSANATVSYNLQPNSGDYIIIADEAVAGTAGTGFNTPYVVSYNGKQYDILTAADEIGPDAGFKQLETTSIYGWVWNDTDYDGLRGTDLATDIPLSGQTVHLDQYYLDGNGSWQLQQTNFSAAVTDADGKYVANTLPVYVEVGGIKRLAAYKTRLDSLVSGYTVTKYRQNGTNHSDLIAGTLAMTAADEYLILAEPAGTAGANEPYAVTAPNGTVYDLRVAQDNGIHGGDAGELGYQTGAVEGIIWQDKDYDGVRETGEGAISGEVTLILERWYYDGGWQQDTAFSQTTVTDANGHYSFTGLETHRMNAGTPQLYGYRVKVDLQKFAADGLDDLYAVTRYHSTADASVDSDWIVSDGTDNGYLVAEGQYLTVAQRAQTSSNPANVVTVDGVSYDVVLAETSSGNDGGLKAYEPAQISGTAWLDDDYDGVMETGELSIEGLDVVLTQYYWANGVWNQVAGYSETRKSDASGQYLFDNLPVFLEVNGQKYLAGYQLKLDPNSADNQAIISKYAVTRYLEQGGTLVDSKLILGRLQLTSPNVEAEGSIVLAQPVTGTFEGNAYNYRNVNNSLFDIAVPKDADGMNAGFSEQGFGAIGGVAWEEHYDEDGKADSIRQDNEKRMEGIEVVLEQYYLENGNWIKVDGYEQTQLTNEDGEYLFDNLPVCGTVDDGTGNLKRIIYGYRVKVPAIPEDYDVADYRVNDGVLDNDLDQNTGYLTPDVVPLANPAADNEQPENITDGYSIVTGNRYTDIDLGLLPYRNAFVEGIVWNDADRDGVQDEGEQRLEGYRVYLDVLVPEQQGDGTDDDQTQDTELPESTIPLTSEVEGKETDGITDTGVYRQYAVCVTDKDGVYRFDNLPVLDETTGEALVYRIRMEKPMYAEYVPLDVENNTLDEIDNDYAHLNVPGYLLDQKYGVTESFLLTEKFTQETVYGQSYSGSRILLNELTDLGIYLGQTQTVIGGRIFFDINQDGVLNGEESGASGVTVTLYQYDNETGSWMVAKDLNGHSSMVTGADGKYYFDVAVADMDEESTYYLTPYRYRVAVAKADDEYEFNQLYRDKAATNALTDGGVLYDPTVDYRLLMDSIADVNEISSASVEGATEGLPETSELLALSREFNFVSTRYDPYLQKNVAAFDDVHVDLGRGAALVEKEAVFDPPKTGGLDGLPFAAAFPMVALLGGFILLIWKRKKRGEENE